MISWTNKKVAILGAGLEGLSSAMYLKNQGAQVTLLDQKELKDLSVADEKAKQLGIELLSGPKAFDQLNSFEILVRTPGIRPDKPEILAATTEGSLLTSNTKIFFENCPAKTIGVTGTKGKGTTATLIQKILQEGGKNVYLGGNIGIPALDFLPSLKAEDFVVLELSSFQLFDLEQSPHVAIVLMVTSEHLDWHTDAQEYKEAKFNIVKHQTESDFAVVNIDYPVSSEFLSQTKGKKIEVSTKKETSGVYLTEGKIYRSLNGAAEEIISAAEVGLIGAHNLENVVAAVGATSALGIAKEPIATAAKNFKGLEHRLEFVREVAGARYYNDTFSTTPETAIAAIKSFTQPEIVILGGSDKGSDYTELGRTIVQSPNIKAVVLIGLMGPKIKAAIEKAGKFDREFKEGAKDMTEIISQVREVAKAGDVVLLSPACASFGMFKNYKQRGQLFKEEVSKI